MIDLIDNIDLKKGLEKSLKIVVTPKSNYYLLCYSFAVTFIKSKSIFTSENMIAEYLALGFPPPSEPRVWGAVIKELLKDNLISHYGFTKYVKSCGHGKPSNQWKVR